MADPLTTSVVTALVTGATAAVSDGARTLTTKLATLVRDRLRRRSPEDQDALDAAVQHPDDPVARRRLVEVLGEHMRDDPAFAQQLRALWSDITADERHGAEITNVVSGQVHGSVVQARDVQGGITLHGLPRPD